MRARDPNGPWFDINQSKTETKDKANTVIYMDKNDNERDFLFKKNEFIGFQSIVSVFLSMLINCFCRIFCRCDGKDFAKNFKSEGL